MEIMNHSIQPSLTSKVLEDLATHFNNELNDEAISYLNERGVNQASIEKFLIGFEKDQIGFQPKTNNVYGYFRNRIVFPLISFKDEIVDLVGRSIDGREPKYKQLVGIENVFFNEKVLKESEDVILCNSIFDVISLEQANLPAISMLQSQMDMGQVEKLTGKRIFICFGNDEIGRRDSIRIAKKLNDNVKELYLLHLPEGLKDVNDFFLRVKNPLDEFVRIINETLKNSLSTPIAPDSSFLIHFQEEYIKRNKGVFNGIETGFKALDSLLIGGLQEGLYLIGGNVSVGKTSFLKQLADQLAKSVPVIFVSWDMTSFELWVRSMSRVTGYSSQEILAGKIAVERIQEANQEYSSIAQNIWTIDADMSSSLEDIAIYMNKIMQSINKKPVIILDHLQRIDLRKGENKPSKDSQLQISYNLHNWSRQWGIPILLAANGNENDLSPDLLASVDVFVCLEKDNKSPSSTTVNIRKNRNGNVGSIKLNFNSKIGHFSEIS